MMVTFYYIPFKEISQPIKRTVEKSIIRVGIHDRTTIREARK